MTHANWEGVGAVLWVSAIGGIDFELCDDEDEAAELAVFYEDCGSDTVYKVHGVQFPDGRVVPLGLWDAFAAALIAQREKEKARRAEPTPVRPTKQIVCPFTGEQATTDLDTPDWIGRP